MDPFTPEHVEERQRWQLAAEVAAHLAEITRWEWSQRAEEAADLSRRLADGIYAGRTPAELLDIVEQLSALIDENPPVSFAFLSFDDLETDPTEPDLPRWHAHTRRTFTILRAGLYPDGRRYAR